jgi:hypothetical protein
MPFFVNVFRCFLMQNDLKLAPFWPVPIPREKEGEGGKFEVFRKRFEEGEG